MTLKHRDALGAIRFRALADAPPDSWSHLNPHKYWTTDPQSGITGTHRRLNELADELHPEPWPLWYTRHTQNGTVWAPPLEAEPFIQDAGRYWILYLCDRAWGHIAMEHYFTYGSDDKRITHTTLAALADSLPHL